VPAPSSVVLLICADREAAARLAAVIQTTVGKVVAAPWGPIALSRAPEAQLIVIDRIEGTVDPAAAVMRLKGLPDLVNTPVLCIAQTTDVEETVGLLEAGADDVMSAGFLPDELRARIEALIAMPQPSAVAPTVEAVEAQATGGRTRVVTFFSPKGGVGVTTLAVNTAVAAASKHDRTVAMVDLDLEWGQVATHLNVPVKFSVVELARDAAALDDPELVRGYADRHPSGLAVFGSPLRPDQRGLVNQEHVARLLDGMRSAYDLTIVDGGSTLDERSMTLFEQSQRVVIVVTPEIPAVRAVHALREVLAEVGTAPDKQFLVLNHLFEHDMLRQDDLERSLQTRIQAQVPYDPISFLKAVNEGVPVVSGASRPALIAKLEDVATEIVGVGPDLPAAASPDRGGRRRIGTLLKRGA